MDVEFAARNLELVETDRAADTGLPAGVIHAARHRLALLRAAPSLEMLKRWKSFGYEGAAWGRDVHSVLVRDDWRMSLRISNGVDPPKALIMNISQENRGAA